MIVIMRGLSFTETGLGPRPFWTAHEDSDGGVDHMTPATLALASDPQVP